MESLHHCNRNTFYCKGNSISLQKKVGSDSKAAFAQNVGIDHGGFDVLMPEEFLDGSDIVAILKQVGGETVSEGMTADGFVDIGV